MTPLKTMGLQECHEFTSIRVVNQQALPSSQDSNSKSVPMCSVVSNHVEWSNLGRQVIITSSNGGMGKLFYRWQLVPLESKIGKVNDMSMVLPKISLSACVPMITQMSPRQSWHILYKHFSATSESPTIFAAKTGSCSPIDRDT